MARTRKSKTSASRSGRKQTAARRRRKGAGRSKGARIHRRPHVEFAAVALDPAIDNLAKIDHIVVLLMENRSFDHMLGYLKLEEGRADVEGLQAGMSNSDGQTSYPVHHLNHTALTSKQDPCHTGQCIADQLGSSNDGFVKNYVATHPNDPERDLVVGYYNKNDLLTYDYLVGEFTVCDHWFSSVRGATWPNRLYAVTGRANGSKDNKTIPIYNLPSFARHLDAQRVTWGWYSDNFFGSTLNLTDGKYRSRSNYDLNDFYEQASDGTLPSVCWIDPIFVDTAGVIGANDDHPPADILHGQELVLNIYHALISNPEQWRKTLLVIAYDEHGGFFDHVPPPDAADDSASFRKYGARVPALLVSQWVPQNFVEKTVFDHTSIIKTILLRFCRKPDGSIPNMGKRVMAANHLGSALTEAAPRATPATESYHEIIAAFARWHSERFAARFQRDHFRTRRTRDLNDFQRGLIRAAQRLQKEGKSPPARNLPKLKTS